MTADPDRNGEPEQIELPRPRRTLLGRLAHWVEHAKALKGWASSGSYFFSWALRDNSLQHGFRRTRARLRCSQPLVSDW